MPTADNKNYFFAVVNDCKKYTGFFQLGVCISFAIHLSNNELSTGKVLCIIF